MAGIYIHIPFCKQACYYCNFHFSTSLRGKNELVRALLSEIDLRKEYLSNEPVETIYFGGGTPSLLSHQDLQSLVDKLSSFNLSSSVEITLEANPDDISSLQLENWKSIGINRLSIGVQSFFNEDLEWMNRAHSAEQSYQALSDAIQYFDNITIDLIYGFPVLNNEKWKRNVDKAISLNIPHISCYALTVEPNTPLYKMISTGKKMDIGEAGQADQFLLLSEWLEEAGYEHYEISNFAKPGWRSRHNSSYWQQKKYLGLGPSAHSFNGSSRQWNVANNNVYIESILQGVVPFEKEILTPAQQVNEYIMTSLRTIEGLDLNHVSKIISGQLQAASSKYIDQGLLTMGNGLLRLTTKGRFFADGIAADLFISDK